MRVFHKSILYKITSVLRFYLFKIFYSRRFRVKKLSLIGKRCNIYIRKNASIICHGRIILSDDVMIHSKGSLIIGDMFGMNNYSRIVAHEHIQIGKHVTIGQMVSILDHDHHYKMVEGVMQLDGYKTSPITIGDNVWIGDKATIVKGVTIGKNVVIGANTLVNKNVPDNCIVGGVPFKILKELS